jgi:hypothetical protein
MNFFCKILRVAYDLGMKVHPMNTDITEKTYLLEFPLSWIEAGTMKNMGFDRYRHDSGDIPSYLEKAAQFPPYRVIPRARPFIVDEAIPVDDIDFYVIDEETGMRYSYNVREWLRYLEDEVQSPPTRSSNAFEKKYTLEISLSKVVDWVESCDYTNFNLFKNESHPVECFLKKLESSIPLPLANHLKPMVVGEGIHPEEIQIRVVDETDDRSYAYRPRPGWVGHILGI